MNLPANAGDIRDVDLIPGQEDPLEEAMATHSSILAWRIPWTEDLGRLQSTGSQRVRHDWSDLACTHVFQDWIWRFLRSTFRWEVSELFQKSLNSFSMFFSRFYCDILVGAFRIRSFSALWWSLTKVLGNGGIRIQCMWSLNSLTTCFSGIYSQVSGIQCSMYQFSSVQLLSHVRLLATQWIAARQASLSITNSRSSLKLVSIESMMPSSHLILCHPLLLLPPIPPSISLFQWVNSSHEVAKVLEFQL